MFTSQKEKHQVVYGYFEGIMGIGHRRDHYNLDALGFLEQELLALDVSFMEEVWQMAKEFHSDKLLGPNGFTSRLYKRCWGVIKYDLLGGAWSGLT